MKVLAQLLAVLSLASAVHGTPSLTKKDGASLTKRDGASIASALSAVDTKVNALNAAILTSPPVPSAIIASANAVNDAITAGIAVVKASAALSDTDALALITPTQTLSSDTNKTITNLIGVKDQIVSLGYGCLTLQQLQAQYAAASTLSADIVALVPTALQPTAQSLSAGIAQAIQNGINAFTGVSCSTTSSTPAPPPSTSSSTPAPPPTTTSASTPPPVTTSSASPSSTSAAPPPPTTSSSSSAPAPTTTSSTGPASQCTAATVVTTVTAPGTCVASTVLTTVTAPGTCVASTVTATVSKTVTQSQTITVTAAPGSITTCRVKTETKTKTVTKTKTIVEPWWCDNWW